MLGSAFPKLCRCCMKIGDLNIFSASFESQPIFKILENVTSEQINSEDKLPKTICHDCYNTVISQFVFLRNYQKVQELLLGILERQNVLDEEYHISCNELQNFHDTCEISEDDLPLNLLRTKVKKLAGTAEASLNINGGNKVTIVDNLNRKEISKSDLNENCPTSSKNEPVETLPVEHGFEKLEQSSPYEDHTIAPEEETNVSKITKSSTYKTESFEGGYSCIDCNESFKYIKLLAKHCKDMGHIFPRRYVCKICSNKFLSSTRLSDHMRIHNKEKPFACDECDMSFTLKSNLKRHKKRHTGEKSYFCEICSKGFIQKHTLTVHMRLHNGETPYVCEICGKGYRAKPLLRQHMFKHDDIKTQTIKYKKYYLKYGKAKVECQVCQKTVTKSALYNHMKVQHGDGLRKFLCNLCGKTYATKMSLDVHMNIHTKQISYNCNICSKSFTHRNYLKTHLLLHSGERPYCCDLCGKNFVQRTHLDRHRKTHTGARPYTCTYCDKAFALNENLKVHVRTHTKETPHYCSKCGKGFFNSSSKKKHENNCR